MQLAASRSVLFLICPTPLSCGGKSAADAERIAVTMSLAIVQITQ
jgi:hypothetical protein